MMVMTIDTTAIRREMVESGQVEHELETEAGQTWTTDQMTAEFEVLGFSAPFVVVRRRSDRQLGSLKFAGRPRAYFGWEAHT